MLIDSHIHIGQFWNCYYSPELVSKLLHNVGVIAYAVSSTTICSHNYQKVITELEKLIMLDGERVLPIMWITPDSLKGNIAWFLESNIPWRCLKIHPYLHPNDWKPDGEQIQEVIDIARELSLPLLIHTGNESYCCASRFEELYQQHPDIRFILAHGRPNNEAICLAKQYDNVFVDSAFMPIHEMKMFIDNDISHKLLWGTDMCIPQYFYPDVDLKTYYQSKLNKFRFICNEADYNNITYRNAAKIFKIIK